MQTTKNKNPGKEKQSLVAGRKKKKKQTLM
jgi:hypothetical protein